MLETAELLCCAGVICSSFKCSDGTQHPAPSTWPRCCEDVLVFIQDRDTEAHCDLEHGEMYVTCSNLSIYNIYNIYTVSTHSPSPAPQVLVSTGSMDSISFTLT